MAMHPYPSPSTKIWEGKILIAMNATLFNTYNPGENKLTSSYLSSEGVALGS